jgi:hypothetical protein
MLLLVRLIERELFLLVESWDLRDFTVVVSGVGATPGKLKSAQPCVHNAATFPINELFLRIIGPTVSTFLSAI